MSDQMVQALVLPAMFFLIGWIVWTVANSRRRSRMAEIQRDIHAKLFEKFGTSQELIEYLKTDAGSKFLDSASIEHTKPFGRVLGSMQAGLILFFVGIAMLIVRFTLPSVGWNEIERAQTAHGFLAVSLVLLALGLGFLASAAASYKLSKNWGLFDRELGSKR
jgi:ABC-type amino acid transport system permease subunit